MSEMHDSYEDQLKAARYRAERDQARQELARLRGEATTMSAYDLLPEEDRKAMRWVRENGGVDECERKTIASIEVGERYTSLLVDLAKALGCGYEEIYDNGGVLDDEDAGEHLVEAIKVKCYLADETARTVTGKAHGKSTPNDILAELRKRLMPEGYEWPRYESGEPVRIGDVVSDVEVRSVVFRDGGILLSDCMSVPGWGTWRSYKEPIKRPAVRAADGVCCEPGTYRCQERAFTCDSCGHTVFVDKCMVDEIRYLRAKGIRTLNCCCGHGGKVEPFIIVNEGDECRMLDMGYERRVNEHGVTYFIPKSPDTGMHGSMLTHTKPEPPESWERIEDDATLSPEVYCHRNGIDISQKDGTEIFLADTVEPMARDLVRRAKALAEREMGE